MKTDDFIDRLAGELAPVRPLRPARLRAAAWLLGSVAYLALLTLMISGMGETVASPDPGFLATQLVGVIAGMLAAFAAFASVVPGYTRRVLIWPAVAVIGWLTVSIGSSLGAAGDQAVLAAHREWVCVAVILAGGSPLVAALAFMLRKGAPMNPRLTAMLSALAVGLLANFGACMARPHAEDAVTLAWHGGAIAALALVLVVGARFVSPWPPRRGNSP